MFRFLFGVAFGIVIGRPALAVLDTYLPEKAHTTLINAMNDLATSIDNSTSRLEARRINKETY